MLKRPCSVCGKPSRGPRCEAHAQRVRHNGASAAERGYDAGYWRGVWGVRARAREAWAANRDVICVICDSQIPNPNLRITKGDSLTVEHIVPLRRGGSNAPENL